MRVVTTLMLCLATHAIADKKIVEMTPGFKRELTACETESSGLAIVVTKTRTFVATNPPDKAALEASLEQLAKGQETVLAYCGELRAMVKLLEDNASTPYKSVGRAIDTQYRVVVKARKEGKKLLAELAPLTQELIPRLNARVADKAPEKKQTGKFPSGRALELPASAGAWSLGGTATTDTATNALATITTRPFTNATCEQQRKAFVAKAGDQSVTELDVAPHVGWRYIQRDKTPHALQMICASNGFVAIADITPATANADEVTKVMRAMLAVR
jgi:hypothetical protein